LGEPDAAVVWSAAPQPENQGLASAAGARARFLLRSTSFEPQRIPAAAATALASRPTTLPARSCSARFACDRRQEHAMDWTESYLRFHVGERAFGMAGARAGA